MEPPTNQPNTPSLLPILLSQTYTRNQALRRVRILKDFINFKLFDSDQPGLDFNQKLQSFENSSKSHTSGSNFTKDLNWVQTLGEGFLNNFDSSNLNAQFEAIDNNLAKVKTIMVYTPFEIPEAETERLGIWFKSNLGPETLFESIFDPELIGGCALSLGGVYKDYSLRQKIKDSKSQIVEYLLSFKK